MPVKSSIKAIACNNLLDFGVGILVKLAFRLVLNTILQEV